MNHPLLRTSLLLATLLSVPACSTPAPVLRLAEVAQLAAGPLACSEVRISTGTAEENTYDAVGCGQAIRYTCVGETCEAVGEVTDEASPGFVHLATRISEIHAELHELGPSIVAACSPGQPIGATLTIKPDGSMRDIVTPEAVFACVRSHIIHVAPGPETLHMMVVFRP